MRAEKCLLTVAEVIMDTLAGTLQMAFMAKYASNDIPT
jgi:hypothetical protein